MDKKLKIQWIVNVVLLVLSLLGLILSAVAWFSSNARANVDSLHLTISRRSLNIKEVTTVEFPYATKIADSTVESSFNSGGAVAKEYIIEGQGKLSVSVDCGNTGMLAYVCSSSNEAVSYDTICAALEKKLGSNRSNWTYAKMKDALNEINDRQFYGDYKQDSSDSSKTNTHVKIVYWAEYDQVETKLEKDSYVDLNNANGFKAIITFTAENVL